MPFKTNTKPARSAALPVDVPVEAPSAPLPLFYRQPEALNAHVHGDLRLKSGDVAFAAATNAVSLSVVEFAAAMGHFPIVFSEGDGYPLAVLGLESGNRFVTDGQWTAGAYIPAYIRRYPFVFAEAQADSFVLAADLGSERFVRGGEAGEALFTDGKPTALTESAMAFCREFHGAFQQTRAFAQALVELELLVPQQVDATLNTGRPLKLGGFRIIDRAKFNALADDVVLDWHKKGWLALVHFHMASLDRFRDLLAREHQAAPQI